MKPAKKNGILTFFFLFLPGAAEMYMGFMKNGLSLLLIFVLTIAVPAFMYLGDVFLFVPFVIYVYAFFHAINLWKAEDESFSELADRYFWEELTEGKNVCPTNAELKKWGAAILILMGSLCIWNNIRYALSGMLDNVLSDEMMYIFIQSMERIPRVIIAVMAVICGIKLIRRKKKASL